MDLVGKTLGKYQVLEEIGQGGMATVYKGYNPALQRTVALKVLMDDLIADQEFVRRFIREAQTAAGLKHPNIVTVFDVEQEEDAHYIVMEFLPGRTLQQEIAEQRTLPLPRVVEIVRALADALDYAHERNLTHRDIKPSNVMIGPEGHVTLMDFGIVKAASGIQLTREGVRIGTPEYMSPEQALGQKVDRRSDIYALGVVLYEMLAGQPPFQGMSTHEVLQKQAYQDAPPPSQSIPNLPPAVEKVVLRALAKRPSKRFQTAGQLAAALEQAVQPRGAMAEARRREPKLKLVASDGREFHLAGIVGVGRSSDNQVQVADNRISRQHAQIRCQGAQCQIIDLGSVNGTFVNDRRLRPRVPCILRPGDRVRLGPVIGFTVDVGTAAERAVRFPSAVSIGTTLRERVWEDRRSRFVAILAGVIGLIVVVLCLVTFSATTGSREPAPTVTLRPTGASADEEEPALLIVVNATGYDLQLQIGSRRWQLDEDERRTIEFPPGDYTYTVTLDTGDIMRRQGNWRSGHNGQLRLVAQEVVSP